MRSYMSTYMKEYYKGKMVTCDCGCILYPHAVVKHQASLKHKYLMALKPS